MHRILFELGPLKAYSYGFFITLGYLAGMYLGLYLSKQNGFDKKIVAECCFYLVAASLLGGRALYVFTYWRNFSSNWQEVFMFWHDGSIVYGGLIAAMPVAMWCITKYRLPLWKSLDIAAIAAALSASIGRIGCFLEGCCYGTVTNVPWAVQFPSLAGKRHPTQIYSFLYTFLIFLVLWRLWNRHKREGEAFIAGLFSYSICRFAEEFFREGPRYGLVSLSQLIAIGFFIGALMLSAYRKAKAGQSSKTYP